MGANVDSNIFKILVATDNHLGFIEKDPERGNDSFNTFEEILELAVEKNVDFVLLGGDLFHENKPSRKSLLWCMELLRKYTFGDRPVHFDFVSDPSENFPHLKTPNVNYQDPNLNVSIPVFSIHGNHDDPSGLGQHSPLEMLSAAGLLNYFGGVKNMDKIEISPLLMVKGQCKLSLYGLSAVKDERLFRLFRENKVKMLRPKEDMDDWFNILVVHQNHTKHSVTNYLPEEFLDSFLELVIWGHEHECIITPRSSNDDTFHILQPGSSVATSLCAGEAVKKQVAILEVNSKKQMRVSGIPLRTVRPYVFEDISLLDHDLPNNPRKKAGQKDTSVEDFVESYIWGMIDRAKEQLSGHPRQPTKPLIRLRVEYSDESQMFNVYRFGYKFTEAVANPNSMVLFRKFRTAKKDNNVGIDNEAMDNVFNVDVSQTKVEDLVQQYFEELQTDALQMQLLSEKGMAHAVSQFVEKDDRDAVADMFNHQVDKTIQHLVRVENLKEEEIEEAIHEYHQERITKKEQEEAEVAAALSDPNRKNKLRPSRDAFDESDSDLEILDVEEPVKSSRGSRGSRGGRGRGSRGGRGSASTRGKALTNKTQLKFQSDDDGNDNSFTAGMSKSAGRGRSRGGIVGASSGSGKTSSITNFFSRPSNQRNTSFKARGAVFESDSDTD